jgi:hypothetical protein
MDLPGSENSRSIILVPHPLLSTLNLDLNCYTVGCDRNDADRGWFENEEILTLIRTFTPWATAEKMLIERGLGMRGGIERTEADVWLNGSLPVGVRGCGAGAGGEGWRLL